MGYGDFVPKNATEILFTLVWMFVGVAFNSITIGALTNVLIDNFTKEENLHTKIRALEQFALDTKLYPELHRSIRKFLFNNYKELFLKVDYDHLLDELPSTIKEEILFHQYGQLISRFDFF